MRTETIGDATLILGNSREIMSDLGPFGLIVMDPPFDIWSDLATSWSDAVMPDADTIIAFTNWQNRGHVTDIFGNPRINMVWHFTDGRWVSNNMPRLTHEDILIYGSTGSAACGDGNRAFGSEIKKGASSIGRYRSEGRVYKPGRRKFLNSVQTFPRNVSGPLGTWGKPEPLMERLVEFSGAQSVFDPFMGGGTTGVACARMGIKFTGIEIDEKHFDIARRRIEEVYSQPSLFDPAKTTETA